jgi:hypothetical protein
MQYVNSLIGRQLKTLAQVNVFHVYDLVDPLRFVLTKAVGELCALLWFTEIRHMEEYLVCDSGIFLKISLILYPQSDVTTAAANVLDIAALIDPSKIVSKIKYHLLSHLCEDIIRFGPLVGVATEVFECFNAIFWYCSILSNHLAPSRDITYKLATQETMKHFLLGSWWPSKSATSGNIWVRPGPSVHNFIASNPILHSLCGWTQDEGLVPG